MPNIHAAFRLAVSRGRRRNCKEHMEQNEEIRFDDGVAYEDFMGAWSLLAGAAFLQWLAPPTGAHWVDIGCGNGAFTELVVERCAPRHVDGIDPSAEQLAYACTRLPNAPVCFALGDAMALPYPDASFDAAVMALVIFFVPDPAKGVAEMARVVRPGGSVSAYAWDILGAGLPYAALQEEMAALAVAPLWPPNYEASRIDRMRELWAAAGLVDIETREIRVERTFPDFETYWTIAQKGSQFTARIAAMDAADVELLKGRLRERLMADGEGRITYGAVANAIKGRMP
jgi:SAM-dependent methyltransferase